MFTAITVVSGYVGGFLSGDPIFGFLTGLTVGTRYYVRAYATNSGGTSYGGEVNFIADQPGYGEGSWQIAVVQEGFHWIGASGQEYYVFGTPV